jgi:transcriptional regulator of acetoin/glycerol metabolism
VKSNDRVISADDLPLELRDLENICMRRGPTRKLDADSVRSALERTGGNKAKASKLLGVGRATLYRFLSDHPDLLETVKLPF